jgi:hypothetical protein
MEEQEEREQMEE